MTRAVALLAALLPVLTMAGPPPAKDGPPRITLKASGSLREVAERIATEGKLSVVVRGDLDEDAEVFFQNVPADEALETLARAYGLSLEKRGNIYSLRPQVDAALPPTMLTPPPPIPPVPPRPPRPHVGHPSSKDEDSTADTDSDEDSDEEADDATSAPEDLEDQIGRWKDLKGLKDVLKLHRGRAGGSNRQRVGTGTVTVEEDQEVDEAVAYGGNLIIKGHVLNDAVAFGGNVQLGPQAMVGGDAVAFGGAVNLEPGAKVDGQTLSFGGGGSRIGPTEKKAQAVQKHHGAGIFWLLIQFAVYFALGFVFIMFAPKPMKQLESEIRRDPLRCALTGMLGSLAIASLLLLTGLLSIILIGIPFFVVLGIMTILGIAMGFSALASELGTRLPVLRASRKTQAAVLALGILVLLVIQLIPVLGPLVLTAAGCVALGATIRTRFGTRPREFPEPV